MSDKTELLAAFQVWKGYPLPPMNSDGQFDKEWLHREWVAFSAGRATIQPTAALSPLPKPECLLPGVYAYRESHMKDYGAACYAVGRGAAVRDYISLGVAPADAVRDARDLALEEAAKLCESEICHCCWDGAEAQDVAAHLAERVRTLKTTLEEPVK